jgi:hypothetical protein
MTVPMHCQFMPPPPPSPDSECMGWGWYLSVDMLLYMGAPLFSFTYLAWPRAGVVLTAIAVVAFSVGGAVTLQEEGLSTLFDFTNDGTSSRRQYYEVVPS